MAFIYDYEAKATVRGFESLISAVSGLNVSVQQFTYILGGILLTYVGTASVGMTNNAINFLYADSGATLQINITGYPSLASGVPIGRVETSGGAIVNIYVDRAITNYQLPDQLTLIQNTSIPSAPAAGNILIYGRARAGRGFLDIQGPSGRDYPVQPFFGANRIIMVMPSTGTTLSLIGTPNTTVGTISHQTLASTNLSTSIKRWTNTSATTSNSAAENRSNQLMFWRGNATGRGGFTFVTRVVFSTQPTNNRGFFGLLNATGATSTSQTPSALTNCLGFAWDSGETTLHFQYNDGSGTATRVDLGALFPTNVTTAVYTLYIQCDPNGSKIGYRCIREDTGDIVDGDTGASTDIPSNTTFLTWHLYMNNGGTVAACAFDCAGLYLESDQ